MEMVEAREAELKGRFLARLPGATALDAELGTRLHSMLLQAARAHPAFAVSAEDMVDAIAAGVASEDDLDRALAALHVEDLWLAQACAAGHDAALAAFGDRFDNVIMAALRRLSLPTSLIDDVLQDVRTKLLLPTDRPPKIASYSGRAQLAAWVTTVATREALDRLRKESSHQGPTDDERLLAVVDRSDGPELDLFRRTYQADFKAAFEAALATLDTRARNVLRHCFVDGMTTAEIGAAYGVHKTTAFRWVDSARETLAKRTRQAFVDRVRLPPDELDSVLRLVRCQLELSLPRVLDG